MCNGFTGTAAGCAGTLDGMHQACTFRFEGAILNCCRVASRNFVTVCLIENVTRSPGMRDSEQHMALGYWPRR
ncbi:hypothetical protein BQ8482_290071 [Mesorhizobium delmotii]|uniref:Uncharacterized protein n=1 Tax=Mesorhizobium delmotii TaxID=1631247 RepID=A0A2P9AMY0_9HYPH|nr:hypothetical protein BQ8482_290071 [Mesorhizobium delmotii]